jgi:hypothetical protein
MGAVTSKTVVIVEMGQIAACSSDDASASIVPNNAIFPARMHLLHNQAPEQKQRNIVYLR